MPNIIEQQDLLKGLPDARLALLMQKPDASIPPFLVAAEAQRRQAIRQQFAGDGNKESVVDSLTKQLANVPQNIKSPMQTPPNIPAPMASPNAGGIGALPQQGQAPQQMADGGPVRRFATQGYVVPNTAAGISGLTQEEYLKKAEAERIARMGRGRAQYLLTHPTVPKTEAQLAEEQFKAATEGPLSGFYTDASVYEAAKKLTEAKERTGEDGSMTPDIKIPPRKPEDDLRNAEPAPYTDLTPKADKKPDPKTGTEGTSVENKYKALEADMRSRIEDLYATDEPSNWEEAQKWFAMSAQIMNPDANLMQGLVNAGAVYADAEAQQSRDARQGDRALQEALLNWDMNIMQSDRAAEAAAAAKADDRAFELKKNSQLRPADAISALGDQIKVIEKQLEDPLGTMDPATKQSLVQQLQAYNAQLANIMKNGGYGASGVITRDQLPQ